MYIQDRIENLENRESWRREEVVIIPVFKLSQSLTMSESHNTYYEFLVLKCNNYWFLKLIG